MLYLSSKFLATRSKQQQAQTYKKGKTMIAKQCPSELQQTSAYTSLGQYAVKVQRSLAPLSRFCGSHIPTAHAHQCCRFQSYARSHAIAYEIDLQAKFTLREPHSWDPRQRTSRDVGLEQRIRYSVTAP